MTPQRTVASFLALPGLAGPAAAADAGGLQVTVRRGALGAFYLEFEQANRTARVRRVE